MSNILQNPPILNITGDILNKAKKEEALCNEVYLINAQKGKFIIKIAHGKIRQDELDKEYQIISKLKPFIALPEIYLYSTEKDYSFFVMQFIDGIKPTTFSDKILEQMALALHNIHTTQSTNENVDFDSLLLIAEQNMLENRLDLDEFVKNGTFFEPKDILYHLKQTKPQVKACLVHGDFRPKNMLVCNNDLYVLDWGLSFIGDPYYDLAIIKWYFTESEFNKFLHYYGIENINTERLIYNEWLSAFLNV